MLEFLNKETAVRNDTGVTVHGSVARLPGVRTGPCFWALQAASGQDSDVTRGVSDKGTKGLGGQPAGTAGRRQVRCRVIPGTADRDYFGGTVVSDKNSCPLEILPASALSDRSERLPTVSDSQPCDIFFPGSH